MLLLLARIANEGGCHMRPTQRYIVELQGSQGQGQGLLPAIRRAVQELQLDEPQHLRDIGLSRRGEQIYLHLYYAPLEEGG